MSSPGKSLSPKRCTEKSNAHRQARDLWRKHRGPIPKGWDIHHINEDPFDNRLENLECLGRKEHFSRHPNIKGRQFTEEDHRKAAEWHRSEEGRAWHRENAKLSLHNDFGQRQCECCGAEYHAKVVWARFCSPACKQASRRAEGADEVDFTCPVCGTTKKRSRFARAKTCSQKCGWELRRKSAPKG